MAKELESSGTADFDVVIVTRRLPAASLEPLRLRARTRLVVHDSEEPPTPAELRALCAAGGGAAALLCTLSDAVDAAAVAACGGRLRVVSTMSAGVSHCDLGALRAAGARLGNTPGVLTDATADLVIALSLAVARRVVEAAAAVRSGEWSSWRPYWMCGKDLSRARCGIIGMGRIGEAVARRLRGFDCEVLYDGRSGAKPAVDARLGTRWAPRAELLATADFVIVLCALTPETRGMIGAAELRLMKEDAVLVNASRGEVVVQDELVQVLRERPRMRAGLDVCSPEPLPRDHPLLVEEGLAARVLVLPHIGSASDACRAEMTRIAVSNALAALDSRRAAGGRGGVDVGEQRARRARQSPRSWRPRWRCHRS
jgi:glyoxylate/hydroxypyruvate reductase